MPPSRFIPLGAVVSYAQTPRGILVDVGDEKLRVDIVRADILRLKISQAGQLDERPTYAASFAMPENDEAPSFRVTEDGASITLETAQMRLVIAKAPFALSAYRPDGSVVFEDHFGANVDFPPGGYVHLNDAFAVTRRIAPHDSIYGLGQKTGPFDRRGRKLVLWNVDVLMPDVLTQNRLYETDTTLKGVSTRFDPYYSSFPFFYHCRTDSKGHVRIAGSFFDNGYKASFDLHRKDVYTVQFSGGQYTEYVFAGPTMRDVLSAYTYVTGRMSAPPLWALGHHQCRFHDYAEKDILEIGHGYRSRDIPCDVLWLDIHYMNGYRVFTWDETKFPDVGRMSGTMKASKFRLVTIIDPGVKAEPGYPIFDEGKEKRLFCQTESGQLYVGQVWPGRTVFPDFSLPETRTWWGDLNARHASHGVAGIWNDMNEPATGDVEPFSMRFGGGKEPHERYHNQYALLMAMGTHEGLRRAYPHQRPFILTRAGFAGIQRYAAQWLGDNVSDWEHLKMSIPMAMGLGISGQPFVGADIPGFSASPTPELAVRWMQYGAMTPFCRCHNEAGEPDQYPWSFGPGVEKRMRAALTLRYRLLPYIYSAFMRSSETGDPIQRPLAYDFQNDRHARETDDAYLFGDALLVAPVVAPGQTARHVYLPQGTWIDWFTGEKHEGGQFITAAAPLDRIPVFARGGCVIPTLATAPASTMDHHPDLIELHVIIPDDDGEHISYLHEDDGVTDAYAAGAYLRTAFTLSREHDRIRLSAKVTGSGYPEHQRRMFRLVFHGGEGSFHVEGVTAGVEIRAGKRGVEIANRGTDFDLTLSLDPESRSSRDQETRGSREPQLAKAGE